MKKIFPFLLGILLLSGAGCAASQTARTPQVRPQPVTTTFQATPGQKFGQMTFEKVDANNVATFTGTVTVTGYYSVSDLDGNLCFMPDAASADLIPDLRNNPSGSSFCFSNQTLAKTLLGNGEGTATVTISGYTDRTIDTSVSPFSTLVKVISKK